MNIKPVRPSDTNGATEVKRTGTEFSAVDFKEAIYKKGQLVRENNSETAYLYKLEHVNSKRPCCMLMLEPQIDQSL